MIHPAKLAKIDQIAAAFADKDDASIPVFCSLYDQAFNEFNQEEWDALQEAIQCVREEQEA